jgi:monoamine oxidase
MSHPFRTPLQAGSSSASTGAEGPPLTRRRLLEWLGAAGGSAAVYQGALALGLMPSGAAAAPVAPVAMPALGDRQCSVVLLGGGLSSLMACLELERAGYSCTILEASHRVGGRNMTLRAGDLIDEMGYRRRCDFDAAPHLYFNAGPARIPVHHRLLLHYCRTLGVELEPFINVDYNAWVHDEKAFGGARIRHRHLVTEARGFITELAAKAGNEGAFDAAFSADDLESFMAFLRAYGDLDPDHLYRGSRRGGYRQPGIAAPTAGMLEPGELLQRLDFTEILKSDFWRFKMHFGEGEDQAAPLMQARGGMDRIVDAFVRHIRSPVLTQALVQRIRVADDGVEVIYQHHGGHHRLRADYCLNCIPMHLLPGIDHNFPARYVEALRSTERGKLFKLGVQMSHRFWEEEHIYGGISWTSQPIEQVWYPSHGTHLQSGILLAAYTWSQDYAERFARMTPEARYASALDQVEKLHPNVRQYAGAYVSVPWQRMNHHMGCGSMWRGDARERYFSYLQQPLRGRHLLMGDQMSYHPGWQEGAFSSAYHALQQLRELVGADTALAARAERPA